MSEKVAEFTQENHKKYACGVSVQKTLVNAFTASDKKSKVKESALFKKIVDSVMKTEKGRETLTTLSELGYSFAFKRGNFGGFCSPDQKKIVINPSFNFEYMLRTVVHEGQHAIQFSMESENRPDSEHTQVAALLRQNRAIEADAVAHEMAFVYECKNTLPEVYKKAQESGVPMFHAFVGEMEKSHDEKKAMQACFVAWYECDRYRDYYDKWHKNEVKQICEYGKLKKDPDCFSKDYPVEDVLKMCCYKGKPYMTADFLNSGKPFSITCKDQKKIVDMIQDYVAAVPDAKADMSVLSMTQRTVKGDLIVPKNQKKENAVVSSAILNQKGR